MKSISDKEIRYIFDRAKQPVEDRGFTQRIMHQLPHEKRSSHTAIVWIFGVVGVLIAVFTGAIIDILEYLAVFGREIAQSRVPEVSSVVVYLIVLGTIIGFSVNIYRKEIF